MVLPIPGCGASLTKGNVLIVCNKDDLAVAQMDDFQKTYWSQDEKMG